MSYLSACLVFGENCVNQFRSTRWIWEAEQTRHHHHYSYYYYTSSQWKKIKRTHI